MARVPVKTGWVGWIWFAGLVLVLAGTFNLIEGPAAIVADEVLVGAPGSLVVLDVTGWVTQLAWLNAHPVWSVIVLVLDVVVL